MPYVDVNSRKVLSHKLQLDLNETIPNLTAGELNYLITRILSMWLTKKGISYERLNTLIGVVECVKQEFYRRIAAPYEDQKMKENGDVY